MTDYLMRLTDVGKAKDIASHLPGRQSLKFTHVVVGDGENAPDYSAASLQNEVWRGPVSNIYISDPLRNVLTLEGVLGPEDGGFFIREMGLIDNEGDLVAVVKTGVVERLDPALGQISEQRFKVQVQVADAGDAEIIIDPTILHASVSWVNARLAEQALRSSAAMMVALTEQLHRYNLKGA